MRPVMTPWLIVPSLHDRPHASAPTSAPSPSGSTRRTLSGAARSSGCDSASSGRCSSATAGFREGEGCPSESTCGDSAWRRESRHCARSAIRPRSICYGESFRPNILRRSSADGKGEEGIHRSFERLGAPLHLGEEKSSLERGEQSRGEVVWVDVGGKYPARVQGSQSITDGGCPPIEPCRDQGSGLGVTLGELSNERGKLAASSRFGALRCGDHHVPPGFDSVRAAENLPLAIDDGVGLVVDDRLHKFVLVGELVV